MSKRILFFSVILLFGLPSTSVFAQHQIYNGWVKDDYKGWIYIPEGQTAGVTINGVKYNCVGYGVGVGCGGGVCCTPISSSKSSVPAIPSVPSHPSGGLTPEQQMTLKMYQTLFDSLFQWLFAPPSSGPSPEEIRRQQEEKERQERLREAQERLKREAYEHMKKLEEKKLKEEARRKEAGQIIWTQTRISEGLNVRHEPSFFGSMQVKPELNLLSSGSSFAAYPAPKDSLAQARCAAYFSKLAKETDSPENARFLAQQAENVMQGAPTDYPCQLEAMPEVPVPQGTYAKKEEVEAFINTYQTKLKEFEDIQTKVTEVRKKKVEAETRLKEADTKITELQAKAPTVDKPDEKTQLDDLLQQAMAAKQQAENELNTAKENEQKLLDTAKQKADELKAMNE